MNARSYITLSGKNLINNIEVIKKVAASSKVVSMIKANAYGHGLIEVAKRLDGITDLFGVRSCEEALLLKNNRIVQSIVLTQGVRNQYELHQAAEFGFEVVIHTFEQLQYLESLHLVKPVRCWLKINSGMGRLGFEPDDVAKIYNQLRNCKNVSNIVCMSHLASAENKNNSMNHEQIATFIASIQDCDALLSLCNSAAIFNFPDYHYDYVRPGLALYGHSPIVGTTAESLGLLPVMTFYSQLISVKIVTKDSYIGYGSRYQCPETMPVGIVGCGYSDGYPITIQDGAPILICDTFCPVIGRISMDMIAVDLRKVPMAKVNDTVVLWGSGLPCEEIMPYSSQSTYSLLTGMCQRVPALWID